MEYSRKLERKGYEGDIKILIVPGHDNQLYPETEKVITTTATKKRLEIRTFLRFFI